MNRFTFSSTRRHTLPAVLLALPLAMVTAGCSAETADNDLEDELSPAEEVDSTADALTTNGQFHIRNDASGCVAQDGTWAKTKNCIYKRKYYFTRQADGSYSICSSRHYSNDPVFYQLAGSSCLYPTGVGGGIATTEEPGTGYGRWFVYGDGRIRSKQYSGYMWTRDADGYVRLRPETGTAASGFRLF